MISSVSAPGCFRISVTRTTGTLWLLFASILHLFLVGRQEFDALLELSFGCGKILWNDRKLANLVRNHPKHLISSELRDRNLEALKSGDVIITSLARVGRKPNLPRDDSNPKVV